jgi:hypothetical protein
MYEANDILARAVPGEEVKAAAAVQGDEVRFDVPDIDAGIAGYESGEGNIEEHILGLGKYRSVWNREKLAKVLSLAGFDVVSGVDGPNWSDGLGWLRVIARRVRRPKPAIPMQDVCAIMSVPRICWTENFSSVAQCCSRLGMNFFKATGVFWGQCMQRVIEEAISSGKHKYILSIDYDSVFDEGDVVRLWQTMETNPSIDALFPLQIQRERERCLLTMVDADGRRVDRIAAEEFRRESLRCETGHFGLTFFRVDAFARMSKPWFLGVPEDGGTWGDGRVDEDIYFWKEWNRAGNTCHVSPRVRIGHLQLNITWPGEDLRTIHQYCTKYNKDGRPSECTNY